MLNPSPDPEHPEKIGWKQHLVEMRRWMRDRGYRDRPLIISEYGILMPELYGYGYERVRDFMLATFDWLRTTTDPDIGYPADGNRLVQAWAWYSLNDPAFEGYTSWNHLFDPETRTLTALGTDFANYTANLTDTYPDMIDLQPIAIHHTDPLPEGSSQVTMTISAHIRNNGSATAHDVLIHFERDGDPAEQVTLASIEPGQTGTAVVTWPGLSRGQWLQVTVSVEPGGSDIECDPYDNRLSFSLLVTDLRSYLPLVGRDIR